jgi:UDP-2,4-diacetamido-2,4,6-trideoxy-beta-L-altropyranose hydrolase
MLSKSLVGHIAVCADGGHRIGYGHLRRTMTVLERLRARLDMNFRYLMNADSDCHYVESRGYEVMREHGRSIEERFRLSDPNDGPIIIDTYTCDEHTLAQLKKRGFCIAVFDDGCRLETYAADVVIDSAPGAEEYPYRGLIDTLWCLGSAYYPMRTEFLDVVPKAKENHSVQRILVTFGGSDPDDQTRRVVSALKAFSKDLTIVVLLGPGYNGSVKETDEEPDICLYRDAHNVAQLFASCDLAVTGAGGTSIELAYVGVPTILIRLSEDQLGIAEYLARAGVSMDLGDYTHVMDDQIKATVAKLLNDGERRKQMSASARLVTDGKGADRIAAAIIEAWRRHLHNVQ